MGGKASDRRIRDDGDLAYVLVVVADEVDVLHHGTKTVPPREMRRIDDQTVKITTPFDRSIDIRIARLRKKVERDPASPELIRTIRGAGYMFVPEARG